MKFSFIIAAYNIENYIKKCLDSILNQTYKNFEIIVIDDGSTDNTLTIINEYLNYENIKIIHQENQGLSYTRNVGMKYVSGDYLFFVDGDDFIADNKFLEKIVSHINDEDIICFNWNVYMNNEIKSISNVVNNLKEKYESGNEFLLDVLQIEPLFNWHVWIYIYKVSYMKKLKIQFEVNKNYEDVFFTYKVILKAKNIKVVPVVGYVYRMDRGGAITKTANYKNLLSKLNASIENVNYVNTSNWIDSNLKTKLNTSFSSLYFSVLIELNLLTNNKERFQILELLKENKWVCNYCKLPKQKIITKIISIVGVEKTAYLLSLRRKAKYG